MYIRTKSKFSENENGSILRFYNKGSLQDAEKRVGVVKVEGKTY